MMRMLAGLLVVCVGFGVAAYGGMEADEGSSGDAKAMETVESSLIKEVSYDPDTQVLTIVFATTDEVYEYSDVPEEIYEALMAAESKGKYFVNNIKDVFSFVKK